MPGTPDSVDEALDYFCIAKSIKGHHIPDYVGFTAWMVDRAEAAKLAAQLPIHAMSFHDPAVLLHLQVVDAARAVGIDVTEDEALPNPGRFARSDGKRSKVRRLNRGKLLLSYLRELPPRTRASYAESLRNSGRSVNPTTIPRNASQHQHREAFFEAIRTGDGHLAFKMIGRLRDEDHDSGELDFLEATAYFHANRLSDAVSHAQAVPKTGPDWPRAFMLALEALAFQGNLEAISEQIRAESDFRLPQFFIPYICQVAVENSATPDLALRQAQTLINDKVDPSLPLPGVFHMWNRHTCQVAVRFIEHKQAFDLRRAAIGQLDSESEPAAFLAAEDLRVRQIACALSLDIDLFPQLLQSQSDEASPFIVRRLINPGSSTHEEYIQALVTQWRIGDHSDFLANVLSGLAPLLEMSRNDAWEVICWAYQEAMVLNLRPEAELLRSKLRASPTMARRLAEAERMSTNNRLIRQLSPMGRFALSSTNWDFAQAEASEDIWRDAGMLSLGFFRVLELEFNERLIRPMLPTFDPDAFDVELAKLKGAELTKSAKKAIAVWDRMLVALRTAKKKRRGLELGALELLLAKTREAYGFDGSLKSSLRFAVCAQLSSAGIEALSSGELAELIDTEKREMYRNPAAHTRYVDLSTARACKVYVEDALARLIEYTAKGTYESQEVH
jgi:hypothetical protein